MKRRTKVLVACGDQGTVELIGRALAKSEGAILEVHAFATLEEATERLELMRLGASDEARVDCAVIDLELAEDALERVQSVAPQTPVVVLVPFFGTADGLGAVERGAQDYFVKGRGGGESLVRAVLGAIERARVARGRAELLAAIAHEFRTRLFTILTAAETMGDPDFDPPDGSWRMDFAREIGDAARDIVRRLNDILELNELSSGAVELHLEALDPAEVMDDARHVLDELAAGAGVVVEVAVARGVPKVRGDRAKLRQALLALAARGVASATAGSPVRIDVTRAGEGAVQWSIWDPGSIPDERVDTMFEPFYALEERLDSDASSVGPALAKRLLEAQGGAIWVSSRPGLGTTFTFTLPVAG